MALLDIVDDRYNLCQEEFRNTIGIVEDITLLAINSTIQEVPQSDKTFYELGFGF